jgi:hypothetical protein
MLFVSLLLACAPAGPPGVVVQPSAPTQPLPADPAWHLVAPLDGIERLFVGPFRCRLDAQEVADFHPNGMVRSDAGLRGRWKREGKQLELTSGADGASTSLGGAYRGYTRSGSWMIALPDAVWACRPGHEGDVRSPGGVWLRAVDAGGPYEVAGKALATTDLAMVVESPSDDPDNASDAAGIVLRHRDGIDAQPVARAVADHTGQPVTLHLVPELDAPMELRVGP